MNHEPQPQKNKAMTDREFFRLLVPSILGILLCMVCLVSSTWAWFSESVDTSGSTLTAATFSVKVESDDTNGTTEIHPDSNGTYTLSPGTYTITAVGTAKTGYCKIEFSKDNAFFTGQLYPAAVGTEGIATVAENAKTGTFQFTITISQGEAQQVTITPIWGTYAGALTMADGGEFTVNDGIYVYSKMNGTDGEEESESEQELESESEQESESEPESESEQESESEVESESESEAQA